MPRFRYRARDPVGRPVEGGLDAPNERSAVDALRAQGLLVTRLELDRDLGRLVAARRPLVRRGRRIRVRDLALFCRQFSTMIGAGVSIMSSLRILSRQTGDRRLRTSLEAVAHDLEAGETLSAAFRRRAGEFPAVMVNMVAAGEVGGILEEVFDRLSAHFEREDGVNQKVRSAMIYPSVVICLAVAVVVFMVTVVLPNYVAIFKEMGAVLPLPTRMLLGLSRALRVYWYLFLAFPAVAYLALRRLAATPGGKGLIERWLLRVPILGDLLAKLALARFSRTLGALLQSGVPILTALEVVERAVGSAVLGGAVRRAHDAVRAGHSVALPLRASGVVPPMVVEMVAVGEESGAMEAMLFKVADFYEREIDRLVGRITALLEPFVVLFLGVGVGFILVSIVMPMFQIFGMIR
ncbi:MAG: type II secretion system F family protein [Acetobacteraceae bacterium]|nr:type II secretion system F family protein [Acetobacteraceae bacterium]